MAKRPTRPKAASAPIDYNRLVWDRLEGIAYPGEHQNLFGHDASLDQLAQSYSTGHMHHAWLVTGPKGTGKATLSLAFAAHIFSQVKSGAIANRFSPSQIDEAIASQIAKGGHPNILHLSRPWDQKTKRFKSTLSIDEVRRTQSFFGTTAGENNWRICIVDTADDMNSNAANALLKILEEPPSRTIFFVLSHSPGKLLPTIRSRCRHLPLRPLQEGDLKKALDALDCSIDHLDETSKETLLRLSGGSVRNAIILLQRDGLSLVQRFNQILSAKSIDWPSAHKLADELARKANEEQYNLLFEIAHDHISHTIHRSAAKIDPQSSNVTAENSGEVLSNLARLCEVWEKTENSASLTDAYNLDKKQVVLNLFSQLSEAGV